MNVFIDKYVTGGSKPMTKPDGSEKSAFCRITDLVSNFEQNENESMSCSSHASSLYIRNPSIQRPIDTEHVMGIVEQLSKDYQENNQLFTFNTITLAFNEDTQENWLLDGQHRICAMKELLKMHPQMSDEVVEVRTKILPNQEMVNEYWMRINISKPVTLFKCVYHQQLIHVLVKFLKEHFPGYIRKNGKRPNISTDALEKYITKKELSNDTNKKLCENLPKALISINLFLQSRREDELKPLLAHDALKMIARLHAQEGKSWYCGLYEQTDILDMGVEMVLNNKKIQDLNFVQNKRRKISRQLRKDVWSQSNNPKETVGKCFVCSTNILFDEFHLAHVIPRIYKDGVCEPWNLKPTCRTCNLRMGTQHLFDYKNKYYTNSLPMAEPVESSAKEYV